MTTTQTKEARARDLLAEKWRVEAGDMHWRNKCANELLALIE